MRADGSIVVNKRLIHGIGMAETIVFSELISKYHYFEQRSTLTNGYFYCTVLDLEISTGYGEKAQRNAINNLKKMGLINCQIKGMPRKRYFNITATYELIAYYIQKGDTKIKELQDKKTEQCLYFEDFVQSLPNDVTNASQTTAIIPPKGRINNTNQIIQIKNTKSIECSTHSSGVSGNVFSLEIFKRQVKACYKKLNAEDIYFSLEDIYVIVNYFMERYFECMNIQHPNLSNETVTDILYNLVSCPHSGGVEFDIDIDSYKEMIDFYFTQDFKGNQHGQCDYSLAHFVLSDDIRANCYYKTCY